MNPRLQARWSELAALLDDALDLPPEQRAGFVDAISADEELRELLRELLASSTTLGILDGDSGRYADRLLDRTEAPPAPQRIGPYRIIRLIGEGGSGSVYLAERDADGYVQQVALKLLRLGVRDPVEQDRFRRERRILAGLQHPNIARLLDGGFDDDGVPWFALEYVDGQPLTAWCDQNRLGVDARLALFDEVCGAIAYAHRALIVHRDLKPANILVDAAGRSHLLDFGIARLLDADSRTDETRADLRRMTPAYAAPEQFDGGPITTATDVYALGVLLHELLAGMRPDRQAASEILASKRLTAATDRDALAAARQASAASLKRQLQGDLDTVIATALATDPQRRYASVEALADDIRRHRSGHPLFARRPSLRYRIGKLVARQRVATALAALLVASLVVGIAATLRESRNARRAAESALHEAQRADAVKTFVLTLFGGVTPDESRGRSIGARELLERGEARLTQTLATQPELEAELSTVLATAWRQLGSFDRAATLAERAVAVSASPAIRHAAQLELGAVRAAQGRYDDAERLLRAALADADNSALAGEARVRVAELLADRGHPDQALPLLAENLADDRDDAASLSRDTAALGRIRFRAGDLPGADGALRQAIAMSQSLHGEHHTETASRQHDLAVVLLQRGDAAAAAVLLDQALATRVQLLGERHPDVAQSRFNLAIARQRTGKGDEARGLYRSALALQRELLGGSHPDVASSLNSLAMLDYQQGRLDDAIAGMGDALVAARAAYGQAHPTVATMLGNLASMERVGGRIDDAERDQRAALATTETALGPAHYLNGVARLGLAGVLVEQGREAEALAEQRRALAILEAGLGRDHADVLQARAALADSLLRAGQFDAAAGILPVDDGVESPDPRAARIRLVQLRMAALTGDCQRPIAALPDLAATLARGGGGMRADLASAELLLAGCLRKGGRSDDANAAISRADVALKALPYRPKRIQRDRDALR